MHEHAAGLAGAWHVIVLVAMAGAAWVAFAVSSRSARRAASRGNTLD